MRTSCITLNAPHGTGVQALSASPKLLGLVQAMVKQVGTVSAVARFQ